MSLTTIREAEVLKEDSRFRLERVGTGAGERFLVKLAISEPADREEGLLEHEFHAFSDLGASQTLTPLRLDRLGQRRVACYRDVAGGPLRTDRRSDRFDSHLFSRLTTGLCSAVSAAHRKGLVLAGFSPASFLRAERNGEILLADAPFIQTSGIPRQHSEELWVGSPYLPYAAPEVLGRASLPLDARADVYALGAVLYELACGAPPFVTTDPAELIQCHVAKRPPALGQRIVDLPHGVEHAVMRSLAKDPTQRYGSVDELRAALSAALPIPEAADDSSGEAAARRSPPPLALSDRLWGRDAALHRLADHVGRSRERPEVVFVEGAPGIGKTALLQQARKLEGPTRVCFGRFQHAGPATPLSGWAGALRDLANVVLTRNPAELEGWRKKILGELGELASLVAALVPEWNLVLRPPVRPGDEILDASMNRLAMAIHRLIACYSEPTGPVVLMLDDLQWADASSLRILELLLTMPEPLNLLVLTGVRTDDQGSIETVELRVLKQALVRAGVEPQTILLTPWEQLEVACFVDDSLPGGLRNGSAFARLVLAKTHGNPFFSRELLRALVQGRAVSFDLEQGDWVWDQRVSQAFPAAENVLAFLSSRIRSLPEELKSMLGVAACLGFEFSLSDFCAGTELRPDQALLQLEQAFDEGLLVEVGSASRVDGGAADEKVTDQRYAFVHDRVLEACRDQMSFEERASVSLRIGRALARSLPRDAGGDALCQLAGYLNTASRLVTSKEERYLAADFDLRAGRVAKARGAFSQALDFLSAGLAFLPGQTDEREEAWRERFDLTRELHEEAAEAALLNRDLRRMEELCGGILTHVADPLQKILAYDIRISGLKAEKKFSSAVDAALEILKELGVTFPKTPRLPHVAVAFLLTKRRIFAKPVERLAQLPPMEDQRVKAVARIVQAVYSAAYLGRPDLFPLLVCRHVNDSLDFGNEDYSAETYTALAIVLAAMGNFDDALRLGEVGLGLIARFQADHLKARVFMAFYTFVFPWKHFIRDTEPYNREAIRVGLEYGDFEFACYTMGAQSLADFYAGTSISKCEPESLHFRDVIRSLGQERSILLQDMLCQALRDLRSQEPVQSVLSGPLYVEETALPKCLDPIDQNLVFHHFMVKMVTAIHLGLTDQAKGAAEQGRRYLAAGALGNYLGGVFVFYDCFLSLALTPAGSTFGDRRRVASSRRKLANWAKHCPANFLHRHHLIEAELARRRGRRESAFQHFERAIELCQTHGYQHELGLVQERAAAFCFSLGLGRLGRQYLRDAHGSYQSWGAEAVVRRLAAGNAQHFALLTAGSDARAEHRAQVGSLDYRLLLKSSQAISSEVLLPRLLACLLKTMLEHAGAQRGILILERRGSLFVEAEADVEREDVRFPKEENVEESGRLSREIVRYVARTEQSIVLDEASADRLFARDPYVVEHELKSVLATPILYQGKLLGVAYLENSRVSHVFTRARLEIVSLLAGQAAISLANARFHALELEAVQARINPHFLFNALSSIANLAVADGTRAETSIVQLSRLYHYILTTAAGDLVTVEQELTIVRHYLELEKLRFGAQLEYTVEKSGDLSGVTLPALLLQPLVENCIRHAVAPRLSTGHVSVEVSMAENRCTLVVQDDGDGKSPGTGGTGFGLKSVQQRLALVYGDGFSMAITRSGGYRVEIEIPASPSA